MSTISSTQFLQNHNRQAQACLPVIISTRRGVGSDQGSLQRAENSSEGEKRAAKEAFFQGLFSLEEGIKNKEGELDPLLYRFIDAQDKVLFGRKLTLYEKAFIKINLEVHISSCLETGTTPQILKNIQEAAGYLDLPIAPIYPESKAISHPQEPWERLKTAFETGADQTLMQEYFNEFLADPLPYLEKNVKEDEMYLKGFTFHYCACPRWARDKTSIRQKAENIIVNDIDKLHENKAETIRIGSFGAGGLLQDLIIVGKLIQKGFKDLIIVFVDLNHNPENAKKFAEMLNKLTGVNIQTTYSPFFGSKVKFDAIYSIDLDNINQSGGEVWKTVLRARDNDLADNGKLYLFGDNIQLILDKKNNIQDLHDKSDAFLGEFFNPSKLPDLSKVNQIKIIATKDSKNQKNFNNPLIAKIIQILSKQFNKPIDIQLYGNDTIVSAFRLNESANDMVIKKLSGEITPLSIRYLKEGCSLQQQAKATYHIFIRELENGIVKVSF